MSLALKSVSQEGMEKKAENQCDLIGQSFNVPCNIFFYKSSPNACRLFGLYLKTSIFM